MSINTLCRKDGDEWIFPCFGNNALPILMVVQFAVMTSSTHLNDLFYKEWQASKDLDTNTEIPDVYRNAWKPIFDFCKNLVEELKNKTITLKKMESLFGGSEQSENQRTIEKLVTAISKCTTEKACDIEWLASNVSQNYEVSISNRIANTLLSQPDDMNWISDLADEIREWSSLQQLSPIANM